MLIERAKRALHLHASGDLDGAEADYRAVIGQVEHIGLYTGFGTLLLQTNRFDEALRWLRRALVLAPSRDAAVENLGVLLHRRGQNHAAERWLRRRLALSSDAPDASANLGIVLTAMRRFREAVACLRSACRRQPDNPDHRFNLAIAMERADDRTGGFAAYRQALCLHPGHPGALENAALCATLLNLADDALAMYRHLTAVVPDHVVGRFWRGNLRLLAGDWANGWADYEARLLIPATSPPANRCTPLPRWDGTPMPEGRLALIGEQGIGDVLLFCRFLPLAAARVRQVVLQVHGPLVPLLQGQFANVTVLPFDASFRADAVLPLLSLAGVLGVTPEALPRQPYLKPAPDRAALWRGRLPARTERLFGLVWAGNPDYRHDRLRSPRLGPIRSLLDTPGWRPVLLQVGDGRKDLADVALSPQVLDVGDRLQDFADTAAVLDALDVVITSDTAVAHLAGAMGKETWLMGSLPADWRWMRHTDGRMSWYPSVRLFRQRTLNQWADVADSLRQALLSGAPRD